MKKIFSRIKRLLYLICESNYFAKSKISHVTYCLASNSGDTALSWIDRRIFEKYQLTRSWNIVPISAKVTELTISKINNTKALVIGGGGLFLPDTNENSISGWQWAISKNDLNRITCPIIVFSVGYNYFPGQQPDELFKENINYLVKKSSFVGLRNRGSIKAVKNIIDEKYKNKIIYQPCITTITRKIIKLQPKKETKVVAFNFAFDRAERRFGKKIEKIINQIIEAMYSIKDLGFKVVIVAHMKEDLKILEYTNNDFEYIDTSRYLPKQLLLFYNTIDVVIGMRGHAQMIPFGVNCGIISLCTHAKMKWFLEDISATEWGIDLLDEIDIKKSILDKFIEFYITNKLESQKRIIEEQNKLYQRTLQNMELISSFIKGK